ncbi:16S rRNA (guanine(527)-N(7))-methyltransferase RsmG [Actinobacteria bacterium YIM 96077]|uniref:Ribosomal RNA small subunit methyltransferase G n=1 Tax=Phytoactinopolyspora halophila TaxID=1981511 RepID=A0A329QTT8_9ACTN|nr:16S rRNA (guanine(527)-N(7))-methyltransferase RsmG [Phytoactinopolyspora halophila]AYY15108.1 16S rRNA (guanine(527)-N(7))-methyltransferase RsmG [Actinobacteria bacterium YIM 96077]RAW14712.1 16S rRNA (guanine(527)-N(7))-methyltransferase RsmG [Phytoactinopolyspora halophila]
MTGDYQDEVSRETVGEPPPAARVVFGARLELARQYTEWLADAGIERGLIGPREVPRLWERHVLNCGVVADLVDTNESVADVGSGAGLPGIPMAIARSDVSVTLIEPMQRRIRFLEETVDLLGLDHVTVVRARAQDHVPPEPFDVVTARAVTKLADLAAWSSSLLRPGGRLMALKGASVHDELRQAVKTLRRLGASSWTVETVGDGVVDQATVVAVVTMGQGG